MHRYVHESQSGYDHLPNLQKVGTELWRGGQPAKEGFVRLKEYGVKTIVNLREEPATVSAEQALIKELGMEFISIPLRPFDIPEETKIDQFLELMQDNQNHSVFVHCLHGMDRTGLMVAIYRMRAHDWTFEDSYEEMLKMGFHEMFHNLRQVVLSYAHRANKLPKDFV